MSHVASPTYMPPTPTLRSLLSPGHWHKPVCPQWRDQVLLHRDALRKPHPTPTGEEPRAGDEGRVLASHSMVQ